MKRFFSVITFLSVLFFANLSLSKPLTLALNWKAEPEFGGFYTAQLEGIYKKHGLDIKILEGGSGTPTVQMLANNKVDFAIVSADEIIISQERNPKNKIKAVFSVYHTSPHIILTHAEKNYESIKDVFASKDTLAVQAGLPYYQWLVKTLGKPQAQIVPFTGGVSHFLNDKNFSQQGFITTELTAAEKAGQKVKHFLVADAGYNPYLVVVAVREKFLKENPDQVKKLVQAVREGWESYLKDPTQTNAEIAKLNKAFDPDTLEKAADVQKPLIQSNQTLGNMSAERWETLSEQLKSIGLIKNSPEPSSLFQNL